MRPAKDYIAFGLDVPSLKEAREYIQCLSAYIGMFKIGLELYIQSGPEIIRFIKSTGSTPIFLDLKLHDIPATVLRAMQRIAALGISYATVHCGESPAMLAAAVKGAGDKVGVVGVTVLTSVSGEDLRQAGFKEGYAADVSALVRQRAAMAKSAGCSGVVCSGLEVAQIKRQLGENFLAITPGIRPQSETKAIDDQKRVTTPAQAVRAGADYLVIGRTIRDADDPRRAAMRIAREIESVLTVQKKQKMR